MHVHESPKNMLVPLIVLAILSVCGGWMAAPQLLGGVNHFEHFPRARVWQPAAEPAAAAAESSGGGGEILQALLGAPVIAGLARLPAGVVVLYQEPGSAEETRGFAFRGRTNFSPENILSTNCTPP